MTLSSVFTMSSVYITIARPCDWFRTSSQRRAMTVAGSSPGPRNLFLNLITEPRFRPSTLCTASSNTARGKYFGNDVIKFSAKCRFYYTCRIVIFEVPMRYFQDLPIRLEIPSGNERLSCESTVQTTLASPYKIYPLQKH